MKRLSTTMAMLSLALLAQPTLAGDPAEKPAVEKRAVGEKPGRFAGQRGRERAERDPAKMAGRLIEQFDKDGDQKLDSTELTEALTAIRERMSRGHGAKAKGRRGQGENAKGAPGGERPKRPAAE